MGCIEIDLTLLQFHLLLGLIETWDVLKCGTASRASGTRKRLIETWDVLKFVDK